MTLPPGQFGYATVTVQSQNALAGARTCVLEQNACYVNFAVFTPPVVGGNGLGTQFAPLALRWRLDDVVSGAMIIPWTGILVQTTQIQIPAVSNSLISFTRLYEPKQVMFQFTDQNGATAQARAIYDVLRVRGFNDQFVGCVDG
jgi:hypothetical protein